jgi:hypothetical protein
MKTLTAKILTVTATEINEYPDHSDSYTFEAHEFSNGLVTVSYDNTSNAFFSDRSEIEANGLTIVTKVEETGEVTNWNASELVEQWGRSVSEFNLIDDLCQDLVRKLVFSK